MKFCSEKDGCDEHEDTKSRVHRIIRDFCVGNTMYVELVNKILAVFSRDFYGAVQIFIDLRLTDLYLLPLYIKFSC